MPDEVTFERVVLLAEVGEMEPLVEYFNRWLSADDGRMFAELIEQLEPRRRNRGGRPRVYNDYEADAAQLARWKYDKLLSEIGGQRLRGQIYQGKKIEKGDADKIKDDIVKEAIVVLKKWHPKAKGQIKFAHVKSLLVNGPLRGFVDRVEIGRD